MRLEEIVVVSGLPRSGTSMVMRMLHRGGIDVLTDSVRVPDEDNPGGYYELEKVKHLADDAGWLSQASGSAVKVVSSLLRFLPADHRYAVVFLQRDINEILASQREMLNRRGEKSAVSDERLGELFRKHLSATERWLGAQSNMRTLFVEYGDALADPGTVSGRLNEFLGGGLDVEEMARVVDPCLYRQKR